MTTNPRKHFASGGIVLFSLLGPMLATSAQSEGIGMDHMPTSAILNTAQSVTAAALVTSSPSPAETTLRNLDATINNVLPTRPPYFHLEQPVFIEALEEITVYEARIKEALDKGYVVSSMGEKITLLIPESIDALGRVVEQSNLPPQLRQTSTALLNSVGNTIGSAGAVLYDDPAQPYPLSSALSHATGGLAAVTGTLFHGNNPLQSLHGAPTGGGLIGNESATGLLAPAANPVSGLNNSLPTDTSTKQSLLAPVTGLVSGLLNGPPR